MFLSGDRVADEQQAITQLQLALEDRVIVAADTEILYCVVKQLIDVASHAKDLMREGLDLTTIPREQQQQLYAKLWDLVSPHVETVMTRC